MESYKRLLSLLWVFGGMWLATTLNMSSAHAASAEYKCTKKCTFCVTMSAKTVCSEGYSEDSEEFDKGRQLKKFVNDGLIVPDASLKNGFTLDQFNNKYFNCELMIRKAEQIQAAAQTMCVAKTVRYERTVIQKRAPANAPKVKAKPKKSKYSN